MRLLSTKKLKLNQRELILHSGLSFVAYNAITINTLPFETPLAIQNVIITSIHAAKTVIQANISIQHFFVVGKKIKTFLEEHKQHVVHTATNGLALGAYLINKEATTHFVYFCGNLRRPELPELLRQKTVSFQEITVYNTQLNERTFNGHFDGVLCYSPSGVNAFAKANTFGSAIAFCIGETTAKTARKYTDQVIVANDTTVESVIAKAVKTLKNKLLTVPSREQGKE